MKKVAIFGGILALVLAIGLFFGQDAMATGNAEDTIVGIMERILGVIADFLATVFNSIADAVKRVWTPSE